MTIPALPEGWTIPKRLTIETVFGCNASCTMCVIDLPTERKKKIMPEEMSTYIIDELAPYASQIDKCDFFGLGEPLLDPHIFKRVTYAKEKGFKNIAFSTNADLLTKEKQKRLLETGMETLLLSIDGFTKETHEKIRIGTKFERVVENCLSIIQMRNEGNYKTRMIMRYIRQDSNLHEWEAFVNFWRPRLYKDRNDLLIGYDMHTWGGELTSKDSVLKEFARSHEIEEAPCHHLLNNLIILSDGSVPLCSEDFHHSNYSFGNVEKSSPLEIFNNDRRNRIKKLHLDGKKNMLPICKECTVLYSEPKRTLLEPTGHSSQRPPMAAAAA